MSADNPAPGAGFSPTPSPASPPALALACLAAGYAWAAWVLPDYNSDHLGCDACHHAILVYRQTLADPSERDRIAPGLADYPQTSHWLAARAAPLFGGDPYKALRAASFATLLLLFAGPYFLLRTALAPPAALLCLLAWQLLCYLGRAGNPHYFCAAYFYSQAVGTAALWPALALYTRPARTPGARLLLGAAGALLAGFAYLCHIVPGVVMFGALGLYSLTRMARPPRLEEAARLLVLTATALAVVLGTDQLGAMSRNRSGGGDVPLRNYGLLLMWVPTLAAGLALRWRRRREGAAEDWPDRVADALLCLLAAGGALQAYCALEWLRHGERYSYPALKFFYLLFPAASLLWFLAAARWLQRTPRLVRWRTALDAARGSLAVRPALALAGTAAAVGLAFLQARTFVENELYGAPTGPERHPAAVARRLAGRARGGGAGGAGPLYYDPALPQSSVFVNMVGLHRSLEDSYQLVFALRGWRPEEGPVPAGLDRVVPFSELILPDAPGPKAVSTAPGGARPKLGA
jgi:hypothetical protein